MLVLGRKVGESVIIDNGAIRVVVEDVDEQTALVSFVGVGGGYRVAMRLDEPVDVLRPRGGHFGSVMLTRVEASRVRLGFVFPRRVDVDREEIFHVKNNTRWSVTNVA